MKILLILIVFANTLFSQNLSVQIAPNPVTEGENFKIVFTCDAQGNNFNPPSFSPFKVLSGPSQSSSTQIYNGRMSMQISFTYILNAHKKGEFFIGPASINANGKTINSDRVKVSVLEPSEAQKKQREEEKNRESTIQNQANDIISKNLFVKLTTNKKEAYIGEQILVTYEIFYNSELNLVKLELDKLPSFEGFWTQEFERESKFEPVVIDGVRFNKGIVKQVLLYPQQTGNLNLDPMTFNSVVRLRTEGNSRRRRSIFDDFFDNGSYRDFEYNVSSGTSSIRIKSLPEPQPTDFSGAVGNLEMKAWFDKTTGKSGEAFTLRVKIEGKGNLKLLSIPDLEFPPDFEKYEPKLIDNSTSTLAGTSGNIIFEYLLIPRNPGEYKINPISYTYFSLDEKKYVTLNSEEFTLKISKGTNNYTNSSNLGVDKENIQYIGKDIRFIETEIKLDKDSKLIVSFFYWLIYFLPFPLIFLLFYLRKKKYKNNQEIELLKTRKAKKIAVKRLSMAKKYMEKDDNTSFYEELSKSLYGYISDKLSIKISELNKDHIKEKLINKNIDINLIDNLIDVLDKSEYARYAPIVEDTKPGNLYQESTDLIVKLEELIK